MSIAEKLTQIAENEQKVYEAGYEKGKAEGGDTTEAYEQGVADGKKAEYDAFWDTFQGNGARTGYGATGTFYGQGFDFSNFYPKYDIRPVGNAQQLFYAWEGGGHSGSLKSRLEECDVVLDTSQATSLSNAFAYTYITELPTIDCSNSGSRSAAVFSNAWGRLKTIEKIIVAEDVTFTNWFLNTPLNHVIFEGVIGNDLDLGAKSTTGNILDKESIESVINHLSDTATGKTVTLSEVAVNNAFVAEGEAAEISLSEKQSDGFYKVTFGSSADEWSILHFAVPMDVSLSGSYLSDSEYYEADISKSGVYRLSMVERVTATAPSGDTIDLPLADLLNDGWLKIKRTDGKDLSSADVTAYKINDYNYDWFELIATKPNWNIALA